ncbi:MULTISPECIES: 3-hydroxyacyl-ACP dehydratase FabZ family protein [Paenibacillus]|uniref:3-hydroxyacyl-ACP dehydratase FabZ family protein n=1 Tax=Paenibacillus TaxID=44249 RepID=UPI0022B88974|nr:beta-hydroxyacyl-ACP dehydratase [Paenibacillus caseinilyticus]MCZ8520302.1 beta-hydroxyacyl-ACP dehydratase [Paenibacillus caseinilyticus]
MSIEPMEADQVDQAIQTIQSIHIPDVLPHRFPFLLVDGVTGYETSKWAKGYKLVTWNEWFITGPEPHMPSTLVLEAIAQLAAFATIDEKGISFLTTLKGVEVHSQAKPGDRLDLIFEVTKRRRGYVLGRGRASVGDRLVLEAEEIVSFDQSRTDAKRGERRQEQTAAE